MQEAITLMFDGGSRGNPGPSGVGVVLSAQDGTSLVTLGRYIGVATNNVAEYMGVIIGLEQAQKLGARKVIIRGDSELIIKQLRGEYRVRHPDMQKLHTRAMVLIKTFENVTITHNLRDKNELADKLANLAMDRRTDVTDADPAAIKMQAAPEINQGDRFDCARCGCVMEIVRPSTRRPDELKSPVCVCGAKTNPML